MRSTTLTAAAAGLAAVALTVSACGSGGSGSGGSSSSGSSSSGSSSQKSGGGYGSSTPSPSKTSAAGAATLKLTTTGLGTFLTDGKGMTLYLWEKDTGTTSQCFGACAAAWPPLTTSGTPVAGKGVDAAMIGTTHRSDGGTEVTYGGHPLYFFQGDSKAGDTTGEGSKGFGAGWYVVDAHGKKIDNG